MAQNEQGTGKHSHKSADEPFPHTKESVKSDGKSESKSSKSASSGGKEAAGSSDSSDLKSRQYKDKDGNIHHHTHTAGKQSSSK